MRLLKLFILVCLCCCFLQGVATAVIYKHVDEKGKVTFSDTPPQTDQPVEIINLLPERGGFVPVQVDTQGEASGTSLKKQNYASASVELFTTSWCHWCKKASRFLKHKGVRFKEYDIERNKRARKRFLKLNPRGGVPMAIINDQMVFGFSAENYERALTASN